jgi:hypothetical protein
MALLVAAAGRDRKSLNRDPPQPPTAGLYQGTLRRGQCSCLRDRFLARLRAWVPHQLARTWERPPPLTVRMARFCLRHHRRHRRRSSKADNHRTLWIIRKVGMAAVALPPGRGWISRMSSTRRMRRCSWPPSASPERPSLRLMGPRRSLRRLFRQRLGITTRQPAVQVRGGFPRLQETPPHEEPWP